MSQVLIAAGSGDALLRERRGGASGHPAMMLRCWFGGQRIHLVSSRIPTFSDRSPWTGQTCLNYSPPDA